MLSASSNTRYRRAHDCTGSKLNLEANGQKLPGVTEMSISAAYLYRMIGSDDNRCVMLANGALRAELGFGAMSSN